MTSRWKDWNDKGIPIPLLGLAAALLVIATVVGVMTYRNWDLTDRNKDLSATLSDYRRKEADCTAAIKAGTDFLLAANNFDYRKPDDWTPRIAGLTAGTIHDYFTDPTVGQDNTALIKAGKLLKSSTVADVACAAQTDKTVRVVAQLDESTQNIQTPDPVKTTSAVWVEVARQDSGWKAVDSGRGDQSLTTDVAATQAPGPATPTTPDQPR
ncbi:hypothetical protein ACIP5Y_01480 [Nocardia sp. NPDC088792]|uniref:hypothetical protein n=1 Tax=Nocardia sp. NPDC088792 TaxID=3364332 RepID=UPI003813CF72